MPAFASGNGNAEMAKAVGRTFEVRSICLDTGVKTFEQQIAHYHQHPASCLNQFDAQPVPLTGIAFEGHGFSGRYPDDLLENPNVVFEIKCSCGGNTHKLLAESTTGEISYYKSVVIADRYFLKCVSCGNQSLLFDPSQNGYNAT